MPIDPGHILNLLKIIYQGHSSAIGARGPMICLLVSFIKNALDTIDIINVIINMIIAVFELHIADDEDEARNTQGETKDIDN
jgi:hypothetical protein